MSIRSLPEDVIQQIKSSVTITSLNDVIIGLVKNALDAAAARILISVDYSRGACSVEDDGDGILKSDFCETGGLGKPHHTSRGPCSDLYHGSRGDFVAALATFSLISITSRHRSEGVSNRITFRNSSVLSRGPPSSDQQPGAFRHGTQVVVHDLFGSMAVRVKQRPLAEERSAIEKDMGLLLRTIAGLILAWPKEVSISLKGGQGRTEMRLRPPVSPSASESKLSTKVSRVLVQASLADPVSYDTWVSIGGTSGKISITGCVSMNAVATRRVQFMSLGIRPFTNDFGRNVLFDEVNQVFADSDFAGIEAVDVAGTGEIATGRGSKNRKPLERWPMFYFRIERKGPGAGQTSAAEDVLDQPRTLSVIQGLLRSICREFLKKHHFRPRGCQEVTQTKGHTTKGRRPDSASSKVPLGSSTPKERPDSPFDLWQRVKVGRASQATSKQQEMAVTPDNRKDFSSDEQNHHPKVDRNGKLLRRPFGKVEWPVKPRSTESLNVGNPVSSTAEVTPVSQLPSQSKPAPREISWRFFKPDDALPAAEPSPWLRDVLTAWDNPAFELTEARIPSVTEAAATAGSGAGYAGQCSGDDGHFDLATITQQARLSKTALEQAEVIAQVDQKFILARMSGHDGHSTTNQDDSAILVLIDQHAADERCQLEGLMQCYFEGVEGTDIIRAQTEMLANPMRLEFGAEECKLLHRFASHFAHWGICYTTRDGEVGLNVGQTGTLDIVSLPPSILERARTKPKLLADLLRKEAFRLEDTGTLPLCNQKRLAGGPQGWVQNFQACPQGILDLLNSRSCRSK